MTSAFLPLFYIICLTNGMIIRQNVIFEQSHDISTTRRRWLVTMVIDLSICDQSIDEFYNSLDEIIKVKKCPYKVLRRSSEKQIFSNLLRIRDREN